MRSILSVFIVLPMVFCLTACANRRVDDIPQSDAGQAFKTRFGTVVSQHRVSVRSSPQTAVSTGVLAAGIASTLAVADHVTYVGSAVAGGAVAVAVHYLVETENGIEYQILLDDGALVVIDQLQSDADPVLPAGAAVIVQFGALNNRVLPLGADVPAILPPPRRIRLKGEKRRIEKSDKPEMEICNKGGVGDAIRESCLKF